MTKSKLIQVTLQDWLPKAYLIPEWLIPLLDAKLLPRSEEWPGKEPMVWYWANVLKDGKEYAVGYRPILGGAKFYLYRY